MEFKNRKIQCQKIQKTESNGAILPGAESFYALITDVALEEGTPLNAENMNNILYGQNYRDPTTGQKGCLDDILYNLFQFMSLSLTCYEFDNVLNLTAYDFDQFPISALDFDTRSKLLLT